MKCNYLFSIYQCFTGQHIWNMYLTIQGLNDPTKTTKIRWKTTAEEAKWTRRDLKNLQKDVKCPQRDAEQAQRNTKLAKMRDKMTKKRCKISEAQYNISIWFAFHAWQAPLQRSDSILRGEREKSRALATRRLSSLRENIRQSHST